MENLTIILFSVVVCITLPLHAETQPKPEGLNDTIKQGLESLTKQPEQRDNGTYRIYDGSSQKQYRERFGRNDKPSQDESNYQNRYHGNFREKQTGESFKDRFGDPNRQNQGFGVEEKKSDDKWERPGFQRFYGDKRYELSRDPNIETKLSKPGELSRPASMDRDKKIEQKPQVESQSMQPKPLEQKGLSDTGHKE